MENKKRKLDKDLSEVSDSEPTNYTKIKTNFSQQPKKRRTNDRNGVTTDQNQDINHTNCKFQFIIVSVNTNY